ncbi:uncharacterized protein TRIREDRAFT_110452 [Trichoderma reesei QM6a]|uniref:Predicted protein n=1 Tax=Hypocrea jecorina (strain QM6a) TaxID=431241 RepID=G0RS20_HYPJQ|nr:uncharacterized protein TRIREDRAFT_110452 [Trichoderma reesei QM6a]EGR46078.1 predicted protein [Trichoderma reesei QM6a]
MTQESSTTEPPNGEAPPNYLAATSTAADAAADLPSDIDLTSSYASLSLSPTYTVGGPDVDTCLAHLKFLHAIDNLKEEVGYSDGLFGIWDSRAGWDLEILHGAALPPGVKLDRMSKDEKTKLALSRLREKRWALYLARAVDRYEAWWSAMTKDKVMLTEVDMMKPRNSKYDLFPTHGTPLSWSRDSLPPLDVLMVMHAHMLNPRAFLEDTIRCNMSEYWTAGMPWHAVNEGIASDFSEDASELAKSAWTSLTGRSWSNALDPMTKFLNCPWCKEGMQVPWTTCGTEEHANNSASIGTIGSGYGDGNFSHQCPSCNRTVNKELLSLHKFIQDTVLLLGKGVPMPGTVLDIQSGEPQLVPEPAIMPNYTRTFPNRMIQLELRIKVLNLINPSSRSAAESPSMADVRDLIEKTTRNDQAVRRIDGSRARAGLQSVRRDAKITTRKMMSRYWENFSPFALDLCGAVMRQGVFIDKMVKLDWLHSPSARATMERLITKYHRFIRIMKKYPLKIAVPTLDVDLAWHTHQLSPKDYYEYTVTKTGKFIDHDDKIEESQLSESFEWTTKTYQELYKEVYSECTCWYCETIRESQGSRLGKLLNVSSSQKLADTFHDSGTARLCPPDNSAHISAHNSVKTLETPERARITAYLRARQNRRLDDAYERAARRAQKKGRTLPPRDQYYDHWGYSYYMYGPFMYPVYFAPGMYYGWDPCYIAAGDGAWANCAAGTCGNGNIAAGGCGGPGGCSVGAI